MSDQTEQVEAPEEGGEEMAAEVAEEAAEVGAEAPASEASEEAAAEEAPAVEQVAEAAEPAPAAEPESAGAYKIPEPKSPLSRPQVIDLQALLKPISPDNPSGEYMRYSGVYDEINEARRADDTLAQGEWQHELKVAEYRKVIDIGVATLQNDSKDLQIAALVSEALTREHGFEGLRDALRLLSGLQLNFWDTLHPEIYEGDMEGRSNAISLVDSEGGLAIQKAPITPEGYSYFDYLDSKKYDLPDNIDQLSTEEADKLRKLEADAIRLGKVTADKWNADITKSRRAFYEELDVVISECFEALKELNLAIEKLFDINQAPSTRVLKKALDDIKLQTDKILEVKREEEPDEVEGEDEGAEGAATGSGPGGSATSGAIQSRADALKRLSELAAFFRKTEPHSPVSYLVTRAVKWGNMPLENWLKDVIKDEAILFSLRQTLGFNTGVDDEGGAADESGF